MMASLVEALGGASGVVAAELRPPRAELAGADGIDAWIDTYHAVHRLSRNGTRVFLTDSAVGTEEEDNLRHLMANIGTDVPRDRIVPFLTAKHPIEYCLSYAERAAQAGFPALVVLGGDRSVGVPRCVAHAWELRQRIRARVPNLALGGWANPNAEPTAQARYLTEDHFTAEFYLTQVVSHHTIGSVERFLCEADRASVRVPGMFGVFYYRSANPKTLAVLWSSSCRSQARSCSPNSRAAPRHRKCARGRSARSDPSAPGTSTSATCHSAGPIRRSRTFSRWWTGLKSPRVEESQSPRVVGTGSFVLSAMRPGRPRAVGRVLCAPLPSPQPLGPRALSPI